MNGHCNKSCYLVIFQARSVKIILISIAFNRQVRKSIYNDKKFDIFGDKYLSQGLIAILRKITQVTAAERSERAGGGGASSPTTE